MVTQFAEEKTIMAEKKNPFTDSGHGDDLLPHDKSDKTPSDTPPSNENPPPTKILRLPISCDKRLLSLDCMVDEGGTDNGCHTVKFTSFKQLLKHSLAEHQGVDYQCSFCKMYFNSERDKIHHEGNHKI